MRWRSSFSRRHPSFGNPHVPFPERDSSSLTGEDEPHMPNIVIIIPTIVHAFSTQHPPTRLEPSKGAAYGGTRVVFHGKNFLPVDDIAGAWCMFGSVVVRAEEVRPYTRMNPAPCTLHPAPCTPKLKPHILQVSFNARGPSGFAFAPHPFLFFAAVDVTPPSLSSSSLLLLGPESSDTQVYEP